MKNKSKWKKRNPPLKMTGKKETFLISRSFMKISLNEFYSVLSGIINRFLIYHVLRNCDVT